MYGIHLAQLPVSAKLFCTLYLVGIGCGAVAAFLQAATAVGLTPADVQASLAPEMPMTHMGHGETSAEREISLGEVSSAAKVWIRTPLLIQTSHTHLFGQTLIAGLLGLIFLCHRHAHRHRRHVAHPLRSPGVGGSGDRRRHDVRAGLRADHCHLAVGPVDSEGDPHMTSPRAVRFAIAALALLLVAGQARAHITPPVVLVSDRDALVRLLSGARRFFVREVRLTPQEQQTVRVQTGWSPEDDFYRFYVGRDAQGQLVAATTFVTEYTVHGPVRVAVALGPDGRVQGATVVELTEETYAGSSPSSTGTSRGSMWGRMRADGSP